MEIKIIPLTNPDKEQAADLPGRERRRFARINANFVTTYYDFPDREHKKDISFTRNIGVGGICFTSDRQFPKGAMLGIELRLPKIKSSILFIGEVIYAQKERGKPALYDIGIKFIKVRDEDVFTLMTILRECASAANKTNFRQKKRA